MLDQQYATAKNEIKQLKLELSKSALEKDKAMELAREHDTEARAAGLKCAKLEGQLMSLQVLQDQTKHSAVRRLPHSCPTLAPLLPHSCPTLATLLQHSLLPAHDTTRDRCAGRGDEHRVRPGAQCRQEEEVPDQEAQGPEDPLARGVAELLIITSTFMNFSLLEPPRPRLCRGSSSLTA